jgi:ferrochelatase
MTKTAVILFNLGGPSDVASVRPFLQNLFRDKAIIGAPAPLRYPLSWWIAKRRAPKMEPVYKELANGSPLLANTIEQQQALQALLPKDHRVFLCMRYWHPMAAEVTREVKDWGAERILLLPLYPQFSTTTSQSSFDDWQYYAKRINLKVPTRFICCYPEDSGFIEAQAALLKKEYDEAIKAHKTPPRLLFSAHGLPQRVVDKRGDPDPQHVKKSATAIVKTAGLENTDWQVSYQSRVGPLQWIKPYTKDELYRAGREKIPLIITPIAFVSEHLETLEELDIEYKEIALDAGVPAYYRVPTVSIKESFIKGLAGIITAQTWQQQTDVYITNPVAKTICPRSCKACPILSNA